MIETAESLYNKFPKHGNYDAVFAYMCGLALGIQAPRELLRELLNLFMEEYPEILERTGSVQ